MLLMTDVLVFLQEKDQKYIFPALVSPSPATPRTDPGPRPLVLAGRSPKEPGLLQGPAAVSATTGVTELEAADRVGAFGPCGAAADSRFLWPWKVNA